MSFTGLAEFRRRMERLVKEAEKSGKSDGKAARGSSTAVGPSASHLRQLCEREEAELLSSLEQAKSLAASERDRLGQEIQALEESAARRQTFIEQMTANLQSGNHGDKADSELLEIKISQEKVQYEGDLSSLSDLKGRRNDAKNDMIEAERQEVQGKRIYLEFEDVVMQTYESAYRRSKSKRSIWDVIFRRDR